MDKKAFTLVSMATVLLIIGIITGIAIKSLGLIDAAKLKQELSNIYRLQLGVHGYVSSERDLPPFDGVGPLLDMKVVFHRMAVEDPAVVTYSGLSNSTWTFVRCSSKTANHENFQDNLTGTHACAYMADPLPELACALENVDNQNINTGDVRTANTSTEYPYDSCSSNAVKARSREALYVRLF